MRINITLVLAFILALLLTGCGGGGGGGGGGGSVTLSGTAASGLPVASAAVSIKDANGNTASATTLADGTYSVDVTGMTAPFLLQVPNPAGGFLYSVATAAGTANVHPFTDMIVRNWYVVQGSDVDTAFNTAGAMPAPPTVQAIATIEAVVRQILASYMNGADVNPSAFNLITTPFAADHSGFDLVLDNLTVTQSGGMVTIATNGGGTILNVANTTNLTTITPPPAPLSDAEAPSVPGAITAIRTGVFQVVVSWGAATDNIGVAGYKVYQNGTQVGITDQPFFVAGAAPSPSACYTVSAFDAAGNKSGQNTEVCAISGTLDITPPSAPGNLVATAVSSSQIDLTWSASTDNVAVAGYRVMVGGSAIASLPDTATSYSHKGLNGSTQYTYIVVAIDTSGNVTPSAEASATTPAPTDTTAPTAPTGVTALAISPNLIYLTWMASTDAVGVDHYKVYSGATLVGSSSITSFFAINLTAATQYCYTVKAYDAAGNASAFSAQACANTADAMTPMQVIQAQFTIFQNLFATTAPSSSNPTLLALFHSSFNNWGTGKFEFAQMIAGGVPVGSTMTNVVATPPRTLPGTQIPNDATHQWFSFTFTAPGQPPELNGPWLAILDAASGKWLLAGNQMPAPTFMGTYTSSTPIGGFTHVENNTVSGGGVNINHTYTDGFITGQFIGTGLALTIDPADKKHALFTGAGTIDNYVGSVGGTSNLRNITMSGELQVQEDGSINMWWTANDPLGGLIGGCSSTLGAGCP